jgi:K+-transporting ATPase ATPase A chain
MLSILAATLEVLIIVLLGVIIARFLGIYMAKVFSSRPTVLDNVLTPIERAIYRLLGINPSHEMKWKEYAISLILLNAAAIIFVFVLLSVQNGLPLNALGVPNMRWDLATHAAISFDTNTDYQHYTPEAQASLFSALFGLETMMFLSAATGIAVVVAFIRGFIRRNGTIGNFYVDVVKAVTRVLLPISIVGAVILALASVPQTFAQSVWIHPLSAFGGGPPQQIALGPVASWDSIEFLGTNGGGYFGANAGHPFQNPTALTNIIAILLMMAIPFGTPFMFSQMTRREGDGRALFVTIVVIFLVGLFLFIAFESSNPFINGIGVDQSGGYLSGAETRFNLPESALFQVTSIYDNVGATSMSLGAITPGAQLALLWGMFLQCAPGGVGTGFGTLLVSTILAIFVGGLMVGRTPEYLGKKIGRDQMRWAAITILSHPFAILIPLAIAFAFGFAQFSAGSGPFAFTTVLYEFTSESANNGSGMAPINDSTMFFNLIGAVIMLVGRYLPIIAMLAIGGSLAAEDNLPPGPGTLKTDSPTFTVYLIIFITVVTGLLFLPVLVMGPFLQGPLGGL